MHTSGKILTCHLEQAFDLHMSCQKTEGQDVPTQNTYPDAALVTHWCLCMFPRDNTYLQYLMQTAEQLRPVLKCNCKKKKHLKLFLFFLTHQSKHDFIATLQKIAKGADCIFWSSWLAPLLVKKLLAESSTNVRGRVPFSPYPASRPCQYFENKLKCLLPSSTPLPGRVDSQYLC